MGKSTTFQKVRVIAAAAGLVFAVWLLIQIVISAVHQEEAFRLAPGSVPEGEIWGVYGIYGALVLGSAVPLDKTETVKLLADWLVAFLALVALTLVPLILLLFPDHAALATTPPVTLSCGSWTYPSAVTAFFHTPACVSSLESRFRWAALVAAVGLVGPYLVMARSVRNSKRAGQP